MKKIMFDTKLGLEQAVLEGRKTMTRRIIPQLKGIKDPELSDWGIDDNGRTHITLYEGGRPTTDIYPKYQIGEIVAIAQSYKAALGFESSEYWQRHSVGWNNKMFVKADLMPHHIKITNIKVERLQDISDEDCLKEGIYAHTVQLDETPGVRPYTSYAFDARVGSNIPRWWYSTPRKAYAVLIDKVGGRGTWKNNPYVFCYELKLIK